jgi:hypothetical protein
MQDNQISIAMNIIFPIIELIDRLAIAEIKFLKTQLNQPEVDWYKQQFDKYNFSSITLQYEELKNIHLKIWNLESDIRMGMEHKLGLEEVGIRALAIRDWNNKRVALKNQIAEKLHCNVREIKKDHASE